MTHACETKGLSIVCPECGRMVPDVCPKGAEEQLELPLEAPEEPQDSLEESLATDVADEAPKRRGRPPRGS